MRYLLIGASHGLGKALAIRLRSEGHDLLLVSSNQKALKSCVGDLESAGPGKLSDFAMDMRNPDPAAVTVEVRERLGGLDGVLYVAGATDPKHAGTGDAGDLTRVNFVSAVGIVETMLPMLEETGRGDIVLIGSVRSARGGREKVIYTAAKAALERYAESLVARLTGSPIKVQMYRLGFMATEMMAEPSILPKLDPADAARIIAGGLGSRHGIYTVPWWWRPIFEALRWLPVGIVRWLGI